MTEPTSLPPPAALIDLTGHVIVVTGAGRGIGAGIARRCSAAGAAVVAHTRATPIDTSDFAGPVVTVEADLTADDGPAAVLAAGIEHFGRVDGLVNNAGIQPVSTIESLHDDEVRAVLETNVTAVHRLTHAVAHHLIERGRPAPGGIELGEVVDGGSIVHVASIEGHQPAPGHAHYATAKAAVIMHARAAASEYGRHGIRVNSVSPGLIDRPGLVDDWPEGVARWHAAAPLGRLGRPDDVGDACVFLLSAMARWITGADLVVDGGVLTRPTW